MSPFEDQTVVITGAASGLGRAVLDRFVELGAHAVGLDRDDQGLAQIQDTHTDRVKTHACDVTDLADVTRAIGDYSVDVLVNCAGITGATNINSWDVDPLDFERVMRVNLYGSFNTSKVVLPGMVGRKYGRVLHIASIAGKEGNAGMLAYSASKAAVIGMAKVQGKEVAGTGVTVNALAPAVIETPMVAAMPQEQVRYMTSKIPMGRTGMLAELVAMVEFIVSPQASFTTGFTFDLSGGRATY